MLNTKRSPTFNTFQNSFDSTLFVFRALSTNQSMPHATDEALMASTGNDIMMEELEIPDAELAEEDETPKKTGYSYSKEHKLKRYYACLRDFMAHFHHLTEAYPLDHEVSASLSFFSLMCALNSFYWP